MTFWFLWIVGVMVGLATLGTVWIVGGELFRRWRYGHRRAQAHHRGQTGAGATAFTGTGTGEGARLVQRETSTEEIVAYRRWRYMDADLVITQHFLSPEHFAIQGRRLFSVVFWWEWDGPTMRADERPALDSSHGIYAMRTLERLQEHFRGGYIGMGSSPYPAVEGEVALSGTVIEGEHGYRAERATIRKLWFLWNPLPDEMMPDLIAEFEARYQCEVTWTPANQEAA